MFEIIHRYTKTVLYRSEIATDIRLAVIEAIDRDANLSGANLRDVNLSGANLRDVNLSDADLSGANLRDANLSGADLSGANLRDANLRDANLSGANLRDANLSGANLRDVNLSGANLRDVNLRDANLSDLRASLFPKAPDAATLRASVAAHIEAHPELHDQASWGDGRADPTCDTPCCVAGWACHLGGGDRGQGVATAATLLLHLDGAEMPDFDASTPREEILSALRSTP
jgi:hypothetical protein